MAPQERARHWQHPGMPGVDLLRAHYIRHTFPRHAHDGYVIAAVTRGIEVVGLPQGVQRAGAGSVVLIDPETPHTAHAGTGEGWSYDVLYPTVDVIAEVAREISAIRGTPSFTASLVDDPEAARLIADVHRAAEYDNALAADSTLRLAAARLLRRWGAAPASRRPAAAGTLAVRHARDLLAGRLAGPPSLDELAAEVGTSPFALLRAFRQAYGLPPHAWLTGERVRAARRMLEAGIPPAEAATAVGFSDQPHLNRHFTRIVGVPPGAYQRERKNVQDRELGLP
ncbi:AraC family ligand binding domain-containing protein [Streptomyces sp. NPDC059373]